MNQKNLFGYGFFPFLGILLLHWSALAFGASEPAFWKATSRHGTVYLLGSMHFGHPSFFPLPAVVEQAYDASDVLVVEVDITKISPEAAMQAISQNGRLNDDQSLKSVLSPGVYSLLTQKCAEAGVPIAAFDRFQPWFVALQLIEAEIQKTELQQSLGIDYYFLSKGKKPVQQLESLESQLQLFGTLSLTEQEKFLLQTLDDLDSSRDYLLSMAEAWRQGEVDVLEKTLITPFREHKETAALFKKIFSDRNDKMVAAVRKYLQQNKTIFFVVGAGHMIGPDGIIEQLRNAGVAVSRVSTEAGETRALPNRLEFIQ